MAGQRSISGRACLPLLIVMIGIVGMISAAIGHVILAVIA
jgi:hypothetical protein